MISRIIRYSGVTVILACAFFLAISYSGVDYDSYSRIIGSNAVAGCVVSKTDDFYCCNSSNRSFGLQKAYATENQINSGLSELYDHYNVDEDVTLGYIFHFMEGDVYDETTTDGLFSTWQFRSNGTDFMSQFTDLANLVQTDFIVGTYRVLYQVQDTIDGTLPNISNYVQQMWLDTGTISNRLNISNGKLDTIINHFSIIEDYLSFINSDDARESYLQQTNELLTYIMERLYYSGNSAAYWLYQIANKDFTIDGNIGDITVQTQDYTSQLNTIIALLGANLANNLTDAIQDITDDFYQKFIGDLGSVDVPATMVSTMQSAVSTVFPFCLVGMFSTMIAIFNVDNSSFTPTIHFTMWGNNPMDFDLSSFSVVIPLLHFFILLFLVYGLAMTTLGWFRAGEAK